VDTLQSRGICYNMSGTHQLDTFRPWLGVDAAVCATRGRRGRTGSGRIAENQRPATLDDGVRTIHINRLLPSARRAFTLMELLVVMAIILVLAAMLMPAVSIIRNSAKRSQTNAVLQILNIAIQDYRDADERKRFPSDDAVDHLVRGDPATGVVASVASLINPGERDDPLATVKVQHDLGFRTFVADPSRPGFRLLVDAWGRPFRYQVDKTYDGIVTKPAPIDDWNPPVGDPPVGQDVYAYLWSLGQPKLGQPHALDASDPDGDVVANPSASSRWLRR
jgi:prepilin-type N-terminal cleavage/methylation domain-containing protein